MAMVVQKKIGFVLIALLLCALNPVFSQGEATSDYHL